MNKLIIPDKLKPGDTIGLISPSAGLAPFAMHRITKAQEQLESLGCKVRIGKSALKNSGHVSASVEERLQDLHEMFSDPLIKMVMSTIGGNHSNQLLKGLDYELIRNNPKIFIGYSDITVLHYAILEKSGLATYYGPCAMTQFGEYPEILPYTLDYLKQAISDDPEPNLKVLPSQEWTEEILDWFAKEDLGCARKMEENRGYEWLSPGKALGPALGGAIPSVNHLAGTEFWVDPKNSIFFIDIPEGIAIDKGLPISDVDSWLADLDNLRVFDAIRGLIIGRPYRYSEDEEAQLKELVKKYMKNKECPILYNANIGHTDPIITLRYGSTVELDSEKNSFSVLG